MELDGEALPPYPERQHKWVTEPLKPLEEC
jgi:hypothetical protein